MTVKTRLAPSPTGHLHIGTVRTALFSFLYARHHNGIFAVRSEDTDKERSKKEFETEILEGLAWLGLSPDEYVRQSERAGRHQELLEGLIKDNRAYLSKEESKTRPGEEVELVRLRNPGGSVTFHDEIRGDITTDVTELGDFIIARGIDDPLFHFAVVADDADMDITHVIRGEDHISNTPRQILIQEALGVPRPIYAHLPLILAADRSKLSKRHGSTSLIQYQEEGYLPEGILNYLALLGWSPGDDRELFSLTELIEVFELRGIQKSGAVWNVEKLESVNQAWMRRLTDEEFVIRGELSTTNPDRLLRTVPVLKERAHTFKEARTMLHEELGYLFSTPGLTTTLLLKNEKDAPGATIGHLEALIPLLMALGELPSAEESKEALMPYADQEGRAEVLWPLRYALSGAERSPDPFMLIHILGTTEAILRIRAALAILKE